MSLFPGSFGHVSKIPIPINLLKESKKIKPEILHLRLYYIKIFATINFKFNCQSLVVPQHFLLEYSLLVIIQIAGKTANSWRRVRYRLTMDKGNHVQNIKETIWKGNIQGILYIFAFLKKFLISMANIPKISLLIQNSKKDKLYII